MTQSDISGLQTLENAIRELGVWTWWDERLPDVFQVEFNNALLLNPPLEAGQPPSGQVALAQRFVELLLEAKKGVTVETYPWQ